jgi:hypothetical protein
MGPLEPLIAGRTGGPKTGGRLPERSSENYVTRKIKDACAKFETGGVSVRPAT